MKILVANGVNLDLLGQREPGLYGSQNLTDLESYLQNILMGIASLAGVTQLQLEFYQSNDESHFLNKISEPYSGLLINPGAWSHTSLALADRLVALQIPYVEVHLSNITARENFRHQSYCSPHATGVVYGLGFESYASGLLGLVLSLSKANQST
jgi:3-dehydroquinate dehydratase-2